MDRGCILIVDDDGDCLKMTGMIFETQGFRVSYATNGAEALVILKSRMIMLMLTDFNMPGMNGLALSEEALKTVPGLKIVMVTGDPLTPLYPKAEQLGLTAVLAKPVRIKDVLAVAWPEQQPGDE